METLSVYLSSILATIIGFAVSFGGKLLGALIVLLVGLKLSKVLVNMMTKAKAFEAIDPTAKTFLKSAINIALKATVFVTVIGILGVPLTSVVTVIASCGVAVGLALQGGLSNLAGGIIILIFKPFEVGNYIVEGGVEGTVETIGIFHTTLLTPDNRRVIIPNGSLMNSTVTAVNQLDTRRVDWEFTVAYDSDVDKVRKLIYDTVKKNEFVLDNPGIDIFLAGQDEKSIKFSVRAWTKTENYWTVYFDSNEKIKKSLDENGICRPLAKLDVKVNKD